MNCHKNLTQYVIYYYNVFVYFYILYGHIVHCMANHNNQYNIVLIFMFLGQMIIIRLIVNFVIFRV